MVLPIEVKCKDDDVGYGFEVAHQDSKTQARIPLFRNTLKGRRARAQFVKYSSEIMLRQHRTHMHALYVKGQAVRFFRFDHAGCVVSAPIDLKEYFVLFRDITFRLLNLSREDQGFDNTELGVR